MGIAPYGVGRGRLRGRSGEGGEVGVGQVEEEGHGGGQVFIFMVGTDGGDVLLGEVAVQGL